MAVPQDVLDEIHKDQVEKKIKKQKLLLNCVPGLKGKSKRQKFILKVYALLTLELVITFGFVLITMLSPSKDYFIICLGI